MSEESSRLERIINRLLDILEQCVGSEAREGIDAVVAGFDTAKEEEE